MERNVAPDEVWGAEMRLCPEVVEHRVKIEGLEAAWTRIETRLERLLWAILGGLAMSAGTLLVMLLKR